MRRNFPAVRVPLSPHSSPQRPHDRSGLAAREPLKPPETAQEQLTRIATFLQTLPTQRTNLRILFPRPETLLVFAGALGYSTGQLRSPPPIATTHAALYALLTPHVPARVLARTRYRQTYSPPQLTVRCMPTHAHHCVQSWVSRWLLNPRVNDSSALFLTPDEMDCVHTQYGSPVPFPDGPQALGHSHYVADLAPERDEDRTKPRALSKQPDVALTYRPDLDPCYKKRERGTQTSGSKQKVPAFPTVIIETGYTESYADLHADAADYLISSRGKTKLAILIHIDYPQKPFSSPPTASSSPSPPPSSPEDYDQIASDARAPNAADGYLPQFTAFIEAWEYTPPEGTTTTAAAAVPPISLRAPGRVYLMCNGVDEVDPCIRLCREDFGVCSLSNQSTAGGTAPAVGPAQTPAEKVFHAIDLSFYNVLQRTRASTWPTRRWC